MVKASSAAASKLATAASISTEKQRQREAEAERLARRDEAARHGAQGVRAMRPSMSASHHMLSAPEAPAPMAMAASAPKPTTGLR